MMIGKRETLLRPSTPFRGNGPLKRPQLQWLLHWKEPELNYRKI